MRLHLTSAVVTPCPFCATEFDPLQGSYAPDGRVVCSACGDKLRTQQKASETQNAGSAFVGACGAVLIALASFIVEFRLVFFLMPLMAIAAGGGTAFSAATNPEVKAALGWKRVPTIVLGSIAVVLALLSLVAHFS